MILVTGATGKLGRVIVKLLRQARLEVRCLVRPGSEYYWLNETGADYFFGDLRDPLSLRRATRGVRHVIHAADIALESTDNHVDLTLVQGGRSLIDVAAERGVQRLVMIGCAGAEQGLTQPSFDGQAKVEAHLLASGLPHTVLRLPVAAEAFAEWADAAAQGQPPRLVGHAAGKVAPLARRDAALMAIAALDHAGLSGRAVNLAGPETLTVREALDRACAAANTPPLALLDGAQGRAVSRLAGLVGRRWRNAMERQALLLGGLLPGEPAPLARDLNIPLTPFDVAVRQALQELPRDASAEDRYERVVHRQFQATVYEAGRVRWEDLPSGPSRLED